MMVDKDIKLLEQIAHVSAGQAAPKDNEFGENGIPFIRAGHLSRLLEGANLNDLPKINNDIAIKRRLKLLPKNAIIFAKSGMSATKNRVYQLTQDSYYVSHLASVVTNIECDSNYLKYFLKFYKTSRLIYDPAYPSIKLSDINKIQIPLPPLEQQKHIAKVLDKADALRQKNKELLQEYNDLQQAIFIDMFGDPVGNPMGWDMKTIKEIGNVVTGNTPPRADVNNYGNYIEWVKTNNISKELIYPEIANEFLSVKGANIGRIVNADSVLVTCIAGSLSSIGNAVLTNRKVAFNQQINAIVPNDETNSRFLYYLIQYSKLVVQNAATNGMKKIITKSNFEKVKMPIPPIALQNKFTNIIENLEKQKEKAKESLEYSEELFGALVQGYFKM